MRLAKRTRASRRAGSEDGLREWLLVLGMQGKWVCETEKRAREY